MPDVTLTIAEAVTILEPRITERQLRAIIQALAIPPTKWRYTGRRGHPTATYNAITLMQLHAALTPWLGVLVATSHIKHA